MVVGAAFYGYKSEIADGVHTSDGIGVNTKSGGTISYTNIKSQYLNNPSFELKYDEVANAYYLFDGKTFISFDTGESIRAKVNYSISQKLAGIMFWDYNNDQTGELLDSIYQSYRSN